MEQQQTLEKARQERLQAIRTLYFNEQILRRLVDELTAWFQLEVLTVLKTTFGEQFKLNNEYRESQRNLNRLNETLANDVTIPQDLEQSLNEVKYKVMQHYATILPDMQALETIWQRVVEMSLRELS
jgi:hypothetical protein